MADKDVGVVTTRTFPMIRMLASILVLILAVGLTEWGGPYLELFLADWALQVLLFLGITAIYGYHFWDAMVEPPEENNGG
tara:strand:- start:87 stop:326 length:240 start_codon:yes stop_codon:yes gene_type:complete